MSIGIRPVVLAGFMASGKSTVGRLVARKLGFNFVDLDRLIEFEAGATVAQIFATQGEARFRRYEVEVLDRLLAAHEGGDTAAMVIAVGGGAVMDTSTRAKLLAHAQVINLTASVDEILKRVGDVRSRPLLNVEDPRTRIETLMRERAPAYAELHFTFDSTGMKAPDVAEQIVMLIRTERARIHLRVPIAPAYPTATHNYDIIVGDGLIDQIGYALAGKRGGAAIAIVTDSNVAAHYAPPVQHSLNAVGINSFVTVMPAGESAKTLATVEHLFASFAEHGLARDGAVIALGGGVVGDTAGFAAASWMRGLPLIQVPTSLLAMADSSIGGKVGVDAAFGKNLIGAFKQPELVVVDLAVLRTLPADELACGWSEIIKAAFISGCVPFDALAEEIRASWNSHRKALPALIEAMQLKKMIVEEDPFEHGRRAWLNLGHTFGHGIEWWSGFAIKHGQAVALGMVCAFTLAIEQGLCEARWLETLMSLLREARLPAKLADLAGVQSLTYDAEKILALMQSDKKKKDGKLRFVLMKSPGDLVVTADILPAALRRALDSIL